MHAFHVQVVLFSIYGVNLYDKLSTFIDEITEIVLIWLVCPSRVFKCNHVALHCELLHLVMKRVTTLCRSTSSILMQLPLRVADVFTKKRKKRNDVNGFESSAQHIT